MGLLKRLSDAWSALRGRSDLESEALREDEENEAALRADSKKATLRLDLEEARNRAEALKRELKHERAARGDTVKAAIAQRLRPMLTEAASIMAQLALQSRLIEEGKPVGARDVMALAQGLVRVFEKQGLASFGEVGAETDFNPAQHQPLGGPAPGAGAKVVVRVQGYKLGSKVVKKALVEGR
ncbi:nucleotide exchange factor GrpE [bacterium]|nr:nucleotide exchange factor GrpE [bacterium]